MEDKNRFSYISTQGFADRLRRRRLGLGLRKQDLAAQVGVSLTTIQQYENGQLPKGEFAVRLGAALRCSLDWLLAGQGSVEGTLQDQWAGLVMVPMVEARLSAGTGSFETSADVVRHYAFREDFLRRKGSPSHMALLRVSGDSMEPRIQDGDLALVHKQDTLENGDLGVLVYGDEGEGTLKRYIQRGNCVVLQPFNPAYNELVIKGEDLNRLHIAGRVVETKAKW